MIELVERCGAMAGDTSGAGGRSPSGSEGEEAFFVFDLGDLCVRHVNAAAERLTGVGVEAWPGKRLSDVLACERGAELREAASLWLANGVVLPPLRGSIRRPAGPPSPVVVRLFPVPNGEGVRGLAIARPPGVGHGPEALAAGGETGQAGGDGDAPGPDTPRSWEVGPMVLLDRPEALAVVDCQTGGVHDCNAALEALTGRGRLELLGRPISLLFADEGAGPAFARGDGCGPGDVPPEGECALRRKSGEVFLAEQRGSVLRGPCGTPRYRLCLFREVVLADQFGGAGRPLPPHELLAALRGADLAPVVVLDPGGAITYASPAAARLLGRDASELIGLRYGSVAELPGAPGGEPLAPALGDGEAGAGVRHAVPLPGGGRRVLGVTSAPLTCPAEGGGCGGPAGEYRGLVLYLTDLTGEEEARRELARLRHRLDEAELLAGLGLQAGSIAHDFKNLLTGILGNANLARFQVAPGSPLEAHLAQIETIAERAADMCKQLLAYSGRDRFRPGPIDLGALARDAAELVRFSLGPRVRLELDLADILPPIQGDPTQLRQVILNLVLNASEAIGEREGTVRVRTSLGRGEGGAGNVLLEVTDDGCGMEEGTLTRIFDPFFTTKATGRGLGLATVMKKVRAHRGTVCVTSRPGKGTTFRIHFPIDSPDRPDRGGSPPPPRSVVPAPAQPGPAQARPRPEPADAGARFAGKVLVIDDEETIRGILARMLVTLGLEVAAARDGREGLAALGEDPAVRCVFLDWSMPGISGSETLAELRRAFPEVPVILMSGYAEEEVVASLARDARVDFLAKPFRHDEVVRVLRRMLGE